jgi:hypothetical protein
MRVSPYDCDCNHDPTPPQVRISAAPRHRRKKREKKCRKASHPCVTNRNYKKVCRKNADGGRFFFFTSTSQCVLPNSIRLGVTWAFSDSMHLLANQEHSSVGDELGSGVGLTGAIRVSFDTSYGKECLTWLIGLAVYITLRADKDNTPPFGALGLRKTATLRAPSLNAEKNNPSYSSYLSLQQVLYPARSSLLDEVYQLLPLRVANHNSLSLDRTSNRSKILHWLLTNRLRPTPQQRHQQATCSLSTRQCISDQRGLVRRWRDPSRQRRSPGRSAPRCNAPRRGK